MSRPQRFALWFVLLLAGPLAIRAADPAPAGGEKDLGPFEARADVGVVEPPGSASYDKEKRQLRVTAGGANVWGVHDDFHFVHRKVAGADVVLSAAVSFEGAGTNAHRKAGLMVRQSLDADAAYADIVVHGDGLISLQYREARGGVTKEVQAKVKSAAATVRLERHGDTVSASVTPTGGAAEAVGPAKVKFEGPTVVGAIVCSHDAKVRETAVFTEIAIQADAAK